VPTSLQILLPPLSYANVSLLVEKQSCAFDIYLHSTLILDKSLAK